MKIPNIQSFGWRGLFVGFVWWAGTTVPASAQTEPALPELGGAIRFRVEGESTQLDPFTRQLRTTVDLEVLNASAQAVRTPFHVVVQPNDPSVVVVGASGGPGLPPYQTFFFDLSPELPGGFLPPGEAVQRRVEFARSTRTLLRYSLRGVGHLNQLPLVEDGGPYRVRLGEPVVFDARASLDPEGEPLTFHWQFGDGGEAVVPLVSHTYGGIGVFDARLRVTDPQGGVVERSVPVAVSPAGEFALARTRTLDGAGLPLPSVQVEEQGPTGNQTVVSGNSGYLSLGQGPGAHTWRFSAPGHLSVFRRADLTVNEVVPLPHPWLTPREETTAAELNPIRAQAFSSVDGAIRGLVAIGQAENLGNLFLTPLHGQSLPLALPVGFSPLQAFWLESEVGLRSPLAMEADLWDPLGTGELAWLLQFDESAMAWQVHSSRVGTGRSLSFGVPGEGVWCLVVGDPGAPVPVTGQLLTGQPPASPDRAGFAAEATAVPLQRTASRQAGAVTTTGQVDFFHSAVQDSGVAFPITVAETYQLSGERFRSAPAYDSTVYGYRRPGPEASTTLRAQFPLRPQFLFAPSELEQALVHVEAFADSPLNNGVLDGSGGTLQAASVTLQIAAGALPTVSVVEIRALDPLRIAEATDALEPREAFELNLAALAAGAELDVEVSGLTPDTSWVLARVLAERDVFALEPVLRMESDATGVARSVEPPSSSRLPGLTGPGQYVLLEQKVPFALVSGTVTMPSGDASSAVVEVEGLPWGTRVGGDGTYQLLAIPEQATLTVSDADTAFVAVGIVSGLTPGSSAVLDLVLGPAGPRLTRVVPADGAESVSPTVAVVVEFSEPVNPASLLSVGVQLMDDQGGVVPTSLNLSLDGRSATLLPIEPLLTSTLFTLTVAAGVQDLQGLSLEGPNQFSFTTAAAPPRGTGAELVIYEPGSTNCPCISQVPGYDPSLGEIVCVEGGPGTADPGVAVILVNEMDGRTATVVSEPDGSFLNFVEAVEGDFISATFVNANGSRITIPVTRQLFDDGRVGLYRAGGILEAESDGGQVQVLVEPGAVEERTRFRLEEFPLADLLELLDNTQPEGGQLLAAMEYTEELEGITQAADISFPIDPADLGFPLELDPAEATYLLSSPLRIGTGVVYQVLDTMTLETDAAGDFRLTTQSPPFVGLLARQLKAMRDGALVVQAIKPVRQINAGDFSSEIPTICGPIAFPVRSDTVVAGRVLVSAVDAAGNLIGEPTPVSGAQVALDFVGAPRRPGQFRKGELLYLSDQDGRYAFFLDAEDANRVVTATHPRFPFQVARSPGFHEDQDGSIVKADLIFTIPVFSDPELNDVADPLLSVSHSPTLPGLGEEIRLTVAAADDGQLGPIRVTIEEAVTPNEGISVIDRIELIPEDPEVSGPGRMVQVFILGSQVAARIRLKVSVSDAADHITEQVYGLVVGGDRVVFSGANAADTRGPVVMRSWPPDGSSNIPSLTPVVLRFNEPIEPNLVADPAWQDWVSMGSPHLAYQVLASEDFREITIYYAGDPDGDVNLSVGPPLADINGNELDQDPLTNGNQRFEMDFTQAGIRRSSVDDIAQGGGVVMMGRFAYALDRMPTGGGRLLSYDLEDLESLDKVASIDLPGRPTTLVEVPAYSLAHEVEVVSGFPIEQTCREVNLLAAFSGGADQDNRLTVVEVDEGKLSNPVGARISVNPASSVVKSKWDPPFLGFFELGADVTSVGLINLQAFHVGYSLNATQRRQLPDAPFPGLDANQDGDYCDEEFQERPAIPSATAGQAFGLEFTFAPEDADDRISDFDFSADFGLLGVVTTRRAEDSGAYHSVLGGNSSIPLSGARVDFESGERPRRMLMLPNIVVAFDPQPTLRDLVLVTLAGDPAVLVVVDISIPEFPVILNRIQLPPQLGQAFSMSRRQDGTVAIAMDRGTALLDPFHALFVGQDGSHPALIGVIPGIGGGVRDFVADGSGLNLSTAAGQLDLVQTGPSLRFITLPGPTNTAEQVSGLPPVEVRTLLQRLRPALAGDPIGFDFDVAEGPPDPDPFRHYYVLMEAPGSAGPVLDMALVAADARGLAAQPVNANSLPKALFDLTTGAEGLLFRKAYINVSVVQLMQSLGLGDLSAFKDPASAVKLTNIPGAIDKLRDVINFLLKYPGTLSAFRLSGDANDALYNHYLAGPFVLLPEDVDGDHPGQWTLPGDSKLKPLGEQVDRRYLQAMPLAWAGISPAESGNDAIGQFASRADVEEQVVQLGDVPISQDIPTFLANAGDGLAVELQRLVEENVTPDKIKKALEGGLADMMDGILSEFKLDARMVIRSTPGAHVVMPVNVRQRNPVVVIPGIMGSSLEVSGGVGTDLESAKDQLEEVLPESVSGIFDQINLQAFNNAWIEGSMLGTENLQMSSDGTSEADVQASDIIRHVPAKGRFPLKFVEDIGFLKKDVYGNLIRRLGLEGYVEYDYVSSFEDDFSKQESARRLTGDGAMPNLTQDPRPDMFVFPYDWRRSNVESAEDLADYVDLVFALHPEAEQIDIVAHSMGGLVAGRYINAHPGQVDQCITIGTPWLGAPKALVAMRTGDFDDMVINFLVPPTSLRKLAQFVPGIHQLLPAKGLFDLHTRPVIETGWDANLNGNSEQDYAFDEYLDLIRHHLFTENLVEFYGTNVPAVSPSADNHLAFHGGADGSRSFGDWRGDNSGVEFHHFFGMQAAPHTVRQVALTSWLAPVMPTNRTVVIGGTPVDFFDSEQIRDDEDLVVLDEEPLSLGEGQYRLQRNLRYFYGSGDGTVPLQSAARGAGSSLDLNAPTATLYPVIEIHDASGEDVVFNAEHNGMLQDKRVLDQVVDILGGRDLIPLQVSLSVPDEVTEGEPVTLSVSAQGIAESMPGGHAAFDFGDGATRTEGFDPSDASSSVSHVFLDDGTNLVSCGVLLENGQAGFVSRTVVVANAPPVVSILGDAADGALSADLYTAVVTDPGLHDRHQYAWSINEGELDLTNTFITVAEFPTAGVYQLELTVEDDDGGSAQTTLAVNIAGTGEVDVVDFEDPPPFIAPPGSSKPSQQLLLRVSGAQPSLTAPDGVQVLQRSEGATIFGLELAGGVDVFNYVKQYFGILVPGLREGYDGGNTAADRTVFLNLAPPVDPSFKSVDVFVNVNGPFEVQAMYLEDGVAQFAERYEFAGEVVSNLTGSKTEILYTFNWDAEAGVFLTVDESSTTNSLPGEHLDIIRGLKANDRAGPDVVGIENAWNDKVYLAGRDNAFAEEELEYFIGFDVDADGDFTTELFFPLVGRVLEESSFPAHRTAIVARDPMGNVTPPEPFEIEEVRDYEFAYQVSDRAPRGGGADDPTDPDDGSYAQELERVRSAVTSAVATALAHPALSNMLLDANHLWILEQGSGAGLWDADPVRACKASGYKPGESDNDYEVFLPIFLEEDSLDPLFDPVDELDRGVFYALDVHSEEVMSPPIQWYFTPPVGVQADGSTEATDDLDIAFWRYEPPFVPGNSSLVPFLRQRMFSSPSTLAELAQGSVLPLTPAEVIAQAFELAITSDAGLREILKDVNFFPFRREHFMYGAMSLERPRASGDDPLGDAGLGRGLLQLKWLIEGAYVDAPGLLPGVPLDLVYQNLRLRGISPAEGFEWGVLQELAWVEAGSRLDLTMQPVADTFPPILLEDYTVKRRRMVLRKAAKAALRAGLGVVATDPAHIDNVLPATLAEARASGSFEDHVQQVLFDANLFSELEGLDDIDLINTLFAKKGDDELLEQLDPQGLTQLVLAALDIIEYAQANTFDAYRTSLQLSGGPDSRLVTPAEVSRRCENMKAAAELLGFAKQGDLVAPLVLSLHNLYDSSERLTLRFNSGGTNQVLPTTLLPGQSVVIRGGLTLTRAPIPFTVVRNSFDESIRTQRLEVASTESEISRPSEELLQWDVVSRVLPPRGSQQPFDEQAALRDLLVVDLFFDPEFTQPVGDHPAVDDRLRSPRFLVTKADRLYLRVLNCGNATLGSVRARFRTDSGAESDLFELEEVTENVYANTGMPWRVDAARVSADDGIIPLVDEQVVFFDVETSSEHTGSLDLMLDRGEFASGGLREFYSSSTNSLRILSRPEVRNGLFTRADFFDVGDLATLNDLGSHTGTSAFTTWIDFVRNAGFGELANLESDFFYLTAHGRESNGELIDFNDVTIFDPDDAAQGIDNTTHWNSDVDWVYLDACATMESPSGIDRWTRAMRGNARPLHMILGYDAGVSSFNVQRYPLWFDLMVDERKPILDSYRTAMEASNYEFNGTEITGAREEPWAVLFYDGTESDTLFEVSRDPDPDDVIHLEHLELVGAPGPCRASTETAPSPLLMAMMKGRGQTQRVPPIGDWTSQSRKGVLSLSPTPRYHSLPSPPGWTSQQLRNGTVVYRCPGSKHLDRESTLSANQVASVARTFVRRHWGELDGDLMMPTVHRREIVDYHADDTTKEWTAGYRVRFPIGIEGVALEYSFLTVNIAGDDVIECFLRRAGDASVEGGARSTPGGGVR